MKTFFTFLLLFACSVVFSQVAVEAKLTETLKQFHRDLVKKNTVSINQQTDKALTYGHSNGWVENKAELIKNLESGYLSYQSYKEDSLTLTINDQMASARFVADINVRMNGAVLPLHLKVLEVWVRKGNRWLLFARQAVKV